jgi:hypothetical protein
MPSTRATTRTGRATAEAVLEAMKRLERPGPAGPAGV